MAQVSISEAARLTGKSRKTLHTYISNGKLTKSTDTQGRPKIDTSELIRFFGELVGKQDTVTPHCNITQEVTPGTATQHISEIDVLRKEVTLLRELLAEKDKRNEDLKQALLLIESKQPSTQEPATPSVVKKPWQFWKK